MSQSSLALRNMWRELGPLFSLGQVQTDEPGASERWQA